jgi:pimeloyl-ACP methyl ester carboxylesterase
MMRIALALGISALAATSGTSAAQSPKLTSIVLVHGAFVDGSGWRAVYDLLRKDGYEVLVVQNPTVTLEGDVAATEHAIAAAKNPVLLVGHSYGGMVITQAGDNPKVRSLGYIAAFAPDNGESVATLNEAPAEPGESKAPLLPPRSGFLFVDPDKFPTAFAADVPPAITHFMAAAQVPWGLQAVEAKITKVGWKVKPTSYLVTAEDRMIPPSAQRKMAKRSGARTVEIKSSHAVMLSHPQEVAAFIKASDRAPQ